MYLGKKEYSHQDKQERFNGNYLGELNLRLQETEVPSGPLPRKVKAYMHLAAVRWLLRSSRRGGYIANGLQSQSLGEERIHKCFLCSQSGMS